MLRSGLTTPRNRGGGPGVNGKPAPVLTFGPPRPSSTVLSTNSFHSSQTEIEGPEVKRQQQSINEDIHNRQLFQQQPIDLEGQLKVALSNVRQLEEELFNLRAEVACRVAEGTHMVSSNNISSSSDKQLQRLETNLTFRERELQEAEQDIRTRAILLQQQQEQINSQQKQQQINVDSPSSLTTKEKQFISFQEDIKEELLILFRHDSFKQQPPDSPSSKTPNLSSPTTSRKLQKQIISSPSPLSSALRKKNDMNHQHRINTVYVPFDNIKNEDDVKMYASTNMEKNEEEEDSSLLIRALFGVLKWKKSPSELIPAVTMFLSDRKPIIVILSATKILHVAAFRFAEVRIEALKNENLMNLLMNILYLELDASFSVDIEILRFFLAITKGSLHGQDGTSLKRLSILITSGVLKNRIHSIAPTVRECACDLLGFLLQPGSDAIPSDFPKEPSTWDSVPSPFGKGVTLGVLRCSGIVIQYGDDGTKFLLHHGLLTNLIDTMYEAETLRKPDRNALSLLSSIWPIAVKGGGVELTSEEQHRLVSCLLTFTEIRNDEGEDIQVSSRAAAILKSMSIIE